MDALLQKLAAHRRRIRAARVIDTALRGAFYASVAACVYLAASKLAGLALPHAIAAAVLLAVPAGMAIREWARAFSLRDCAVHLDRLLGLEERLSTAVEVTGGSMAMPVAEDAAVALQRASFPPRKLPREARLLGASALLCAAFLVIPAPESSGAKGDPAFEELMKEEAARLESMANLDVRFEEVTALLKQGRAEEALSALRTLQAALERRMLEGGAGPETARLVEQAAASAEAISAELARLGRTVHAAPPVIATAKLERQRIVAAADTAESPDSRPRLTAAQVGKADWSPRYHSVILKYFEERNP